MQLADVSLVTVAGESVAFRDVLDRPTIVILPRYFG